MITVAIILVLLGGSLTAFLKFNKLQAIEADARQLVSEVNRVRSLAANLQYPAGCTSLTGFNVKSDIDLSGVIVTTMCNSGNVVVTTPDLLKASVYSAAFDITFSPGSGYLVGGTDQEIQIEDIVDSSTIKKVTVGTYGTIFISL